MGDPVTVSSGLVWVLGGVLGLLSLGVTVWGVLTSIRAGQDNRRYAAIYARFERVEGTQKKDGERIARLESEYAHAKESLKMVRDLVEARL